jgi:7-cyano-7-deazaguanine synthase
MGRLYSSAAARTAQPVSPGPFSGSRASRPSALIMASDIAWNSIAADHFGAPSTRTFPNGPHTCEDHTLPLDALKAIADSALTRDVEIAVRADGLPNTFVPGRNIVFLSFAAALAYRRGLRHLVAGMCETDYSGYPDCRDDTLKALQVALNLGMERRFILHTPLMWLDKAATWRLAEELGGQDLVRMIVEETHTCYQGDRTRQHSWGFGCDACPGCELRRNGWNAYSAELALKVRRTRYSAHV